MKLGANLNWLFTEHPMLGRFKLAKSHGFEAVELLTPYSETKENLRDALDASNLPLCLINTPMLADGLGRLGFGAVPAMVAEFQTGFEAALAYATALNVPRIHVLSGIGNGHECFETFVTNLRWAADLANNIALTVEPLNPIDTPGYFMNDFGLAAKLIQAVDRPNIGLQFDIYHAEMIGNALALWDQFGHISTHVQLGGAPGRREPDRGQLDLKRFAEKLRATHFEGVVSGEYKPDANTEDSLEWMRTMREGIRRG